MEVVDHAEVVARAVIGHAVDRTVHLAVRHHPSHVRLLQACAARRCPKAAFLIHAFGIVGIHHPPIHVSRRTCYSVRGNYFIADKSSCLWRADTPCV